MPPARRQRRQKGQDEPRWDDQRWPLLTASAAGREPAEIAAAAQRAQLLVEQGYGPLMPWLTAPSPHDSEIAAAVRRQRQQQDPQGQQQALDLFG